MRLIQCLFLLLTLLGHFSFAQEEGTTDTIPQKEGQSDYVPLIREDSFDMMLLNVKSFDKNLYQENLTALLNDCIDWFYPSTIANSDVKLVKYALNQMVIDSCKKKNILITPLQAAGVTEAYMVGMECDPEVIAASIAIPIDGIEKGAIDEIRRALMISGYTVKSTFVRHGYLFAPMLRDKEMDVDDFKALIRREFTELKTFDNPKFETALAAYPNAEFRYVIVDPYIVHCVVEEMIDGFFSEGSENDLASDSPSSVLVNQLKEDILLLSSEVDYAIQAYDQEEFSWNLKIAFQTEDGVANFEKILVELKTNLMDFIKTLDEETLTEEQKQQLSDLLPKAFDILHPVVDGKSITWKFDRPFVENNREYIKSVMALWLDEENTEE